MDDDCAADADARALTSGGTYAILLAPVRRSLRMLAWQQGCLLLVCRKTTLPYIAAKSKWIESRLIRQFISSMSARKMPDKLPDAIEEESEHELPGDHFPTIAERHRAQYLQAQRKETTETSTQLRVILSKTWNAIRKLPLWQKIVGIAVTLATIGGIIQLLEYIFGPVRPAVTYLQSPTPTNTLTPTMTATLTPTVTPTLTPTPPPTQTPIPGPTVTPSPTPGVLQEISDTFFSLPLVLQGTIYLLIGFAILLFVATVLVGSISELFDRASDFLQERHTQKEKDAQWNLFRKTVSRRLKKHNIVCELCLSNWREIYDLPSAFRKYALKYPTIAKSGSAEPGHLRSHVSQFHSSENIDGLAHIVGLPTQLERARDSLRWPHSVGWGIGLLCLLVVLILSGQHDSGIHYQADLHSVPISLSTGHVYTRTLGQSFADTPSNPEIDGVRFVLSSDSPVIETESQYSSNPATVTIPVDLDNVVKVHLLINMSYGSPKYAKHKEIAGKRIARIWFLSDQQDYYWELQAGRDIREWVVGSKGAVDIVAGHVDTIWESQHQESGSNAVIDHLILSAPDDMRNGRLEHIIIEDLSRQALNSPNPGILVFGITVECAQ